MKVVDISDWQEHVDWEGLKAAGFTGVIIKIGEGSKLADMFIEHVNNAVKYGFRYGVYYFGHASSQDEATKEALKVDDWITEYLNGKNPELGIWYDAESRDMLEGEQNIVYPITKFITTLNAAGYNYVGLYSFYDWLTNVIDLSCLPDYVPIWASQTGYHENSFMVEHPERVVKMWQHTYQYSEALPYDANIYYE